MAPDRTALVPTQAPFVIENHGSIVIVQPFTPEARA